MSLAAGVCIGLLIVVLSLLGVFSVRRAVEVFIARDGAGLFLTTS
jgi:hypothetical protein